MNQILDAQLKKLKTDYIDYYLLHALNGAGGLERLKKLGLQDFITQAKKDGKIRSFGFSYHGNKDEFKSIVDDMDWDFCQIQYNYLDEHFQAGREGLEYAASKGLGVVIMEPLRGGSLAGRMPEEIQRLWDSAGVRRSPVEWALRWIWDHPAVTTVLSGMNEEAHIAENCRLASDAKAGSLTQDEKTLIDKVKKEFYRLMKVGCTGCGYCMPCPAGVNIPFCFTYYNTRHFFKAKRANLQYIAFAGGLMGGEPSYASLCIRCGKCEKYCPQNIPIRDKLREVAADMEPIVIRPVLRLVRTYYKFRGRKKDPRR